MNKYVKNSAWIIVGQIGQAIIALIVGSLSARYLGPSNYGIINYVASYITFFICVSNLGMDSIAVNEILSNPNETGTTIGTMLIAKLSSSIFCSAALVFIISVVDRGDNITITVSAIYSTYLVFQTFKTFYYWYQSRLQSKTTTLVGLFSYVLMSLYKIVLLILHLDIHWFAFSNSVDAIISGVIMLSLYKKDGGQTLHFSIDVFKSIMKRSSPFIIAGLIQVVYQKTDSIMLKHMISQEEVGIYASAATLVNYGKMVLAAITDSARPAIITAKKLGTDQYEHRLSQSFCIIIYSGILISIGLGVCSKVLVSIIYGQDYLRAVIPLMILAWDCLFLYITTTRNIWMICENYQKYTIIFCAAGVVINILLNSLMIPSLGASGAAIATVITQIVSGIIMCFVFNKTRRCMYLLGKGLFIHKSFTKDELRSITNTIFRFKK